MPAQSTVELGGERVEQGRLRRKDPQPRFGQREPRRPIHFRIAAAKAGAATRVAASETAMIRSLIYFLPNNFSTSSMASFTHVGRPWLHWPECGVTSIVRSSAFISATLSVRPARTDP